MNYAYIRSSKGALGAAEQRRLLEDPAIAEIVTEDDSGKGQPRLDHLIGTLRSGDCVTVTSLDRLAPSLQQLLSVLATFMTQRAHIRSVKEDTDTKRFGDIGGEVSEMLNAVLAAERAFLIERVQKGRANVQRKGVKLGRRSKLTSDQVRHARRLLDLGEGGRAVARTFGVSEATLYRNLRRLSK